jgi:hypothetical protein
LVVSPFLGKIINYMASVSAFVEMQQLKRGLKVIKVFILTIMILLGLSKPILANEKSPTIGGAIEFFKENIKRKKIYSVTYFPILVNSEIGAIQFGDCVLYFDGEESSKPYKRIIAFAINFKDINIYEYNYQPRESDPIDYRSNSGIEFRGDTRYLNLVDIADANGVITYTPNKDVNEPIPLIRLNIPDSDIRKRMITAFNFIKEKCDEGKKFGF